MIEAHDILARRNEIKDSIAAQQWESALKRLLDFVEDFSPALLLQVLSISESYHQSKQVSDPWPLAASLMDILSQSEQSYAIS
ncbi:MAG: hypothetical protein AAF804_02470 [Bacteroidota bacterium]